MRAGTLDFESVGVKVEIRSKHSGFITVEDRNFNGFASNGHIHMVDVARFGIFIWWMGLARFGIYSW